MARSSNSILPQDEEKGWTLSSRELLETWWNLRVVRVEGDHPFNRTGVPFQAFCSSSKLNCNPKKGAIAVTLHNRLWHHVKIAKTGPVLAEPLPSVHIYNKEEELLQTALQEVNLDETLTVGEDKPETLVQIRTQNSSDDKREDPVNQQIRNSPIQPLIPLQQVLDRAAHHPSDRYSCLRAGQVTGMDLLSTIRPNMSAKCQWGRTVTVMAILWGMGYEWHIKILY
jgi:hypothetical protein